MNTTVPINETWQGERGRFNSIEPTSFDFISWLYCDQGFSLNLNRNYLDYSNKIQKNKILKINTNQSNQTKNMNTTRFERLRKIYRRQYVNTYCIYNKKYPRS